MTKFHTTTALNEHAISLGLVAALVLASAPALAGKPAPPPPPDPCKFPSVVTDATFPSFIFSRNITVKNGPYTIGTFLADASGKCEKKISESWPGAQEVNLRYDADTRRVLVVGDGLVARMTQVTFGPATGPSVPFLGPTIALLTGAALSFIPADLTSDGWTSYGTYDPRISSSGTQILFQRVYLNQNSTQTWSLDTFWTCALTYDVDSTIQPIDPSSCTEVHRAPVNDNNNYGSHASWGVHDGTIYVVQPSSNGVWRQFSLYRLTLPPAPSPGLVEIFSNGTVFDYVRATATTDPTVSNGELVAVYEFDPPPRSCSTAFVIDAYENCAGIGSCTILNNQGQGNGLRSVTWLPDGRVAGRGQMAPNRQGRCYTTGENASLGGTLDAFPAIDPYGTPATVLTTGGGYFEGAEGGW
jgi:hypothetical protein